VLDGEAQVRRWSSTRPGTLAGRTTQVVYVALIGAVGAGVAASAPASNVVPRNSTTAVVSGPQLGAVPAAVTALAPSASSANHVVACCTPAAALSRVSVPRSAAATPKNAVASATITKPSRLMLTSSSTRVNPWSPSRPLSTRSPCTGAG
jgi:hypothetical protein